MKITDLRRETPSLLGEAVAKLLKLSKIEVKNYTFGSAM
jgi:hypothetical protein